MTQWFKKLTAVLLLTLFLSVPSVLASGKMEVGIGKRVEMTADSKKSGAEYKWVVKKGNEIVSTQSGRNFLYQFSLQGEYVINLTATSPGNVVESTTIKVLAGERYQRPFEGGEGDVDGGVVGGLSLNLVLETLPQTLPDGRVNILGDGKVRFDLSLSLGNILEYRIDKNVFADSDGNGVANDDIDNSDHTSYLTGQAWQTEYEKGEAAKIVAEVTLVDTNGKKVKEQVEILFEERDETGDPVAILDVSPAAGSDGAIHLYEDPHRVGFYARRSTGKILEYRIDKNIFFDNDGDGDPANDIDNLNDISFSTGDVWEAEYAKTDDQIIAQLIVVGEGGKGSRVQKGIVFGSKPAPSLTAVEGAIRLTSDKDLVIKGDPITFTVAGLQLGLDQYLFEWDFDGDGETDKEIEGSSSVEHIYEFPGVFEVKVVVSDQEGNTAERTLEITSKDTVLTQADFTFEVDGNKATFKSTSTAASNLADQELDYQWSFGDTDPEGYESQRGQIGLSDPTYSYRFAGTYLVTLTVTDADQVTDSKSAEVEIAEGFTPVTPDADGDAVDSEPEEAGNIFLTLLKILLYLILVVIVLIVLIIGGFLVFSKIQHPDLTFDELVDELKAKILGKLGVHEMDEHVPPPSEAVPQPPPAPGPEVEVVPEQEPAPVETPVEEEPTVPEEPAQPPAGAGPEVSEPPLAAEEGPKPAWMQEKNVIEGEVEEEPIGEPIGEPIEEPVESTPVPEATEAPVPETPVEEEEVLDQGETSAPTDEIDEGPSEPPASGPPPSEPPPSGETDAPASEKGPVPDWLKGV